MRIDILASILFFEVIWISTHDINFRMTHLFSLFLFQKGCLIAKRMKDGGLGLFDEKLISGRLKYDHSGTIHLFTENVLDQFSRIVSGIPQQTISHHSRISKLWTSSIRFELDAPGRLHSTRGDSTDMRVTPEIKFLLGVLAAGTFLYLWNMNFPQMVCLTSDDGAMVVF